MKNKAILPLIIIACLFCSHCAVIINKDDVIDAEPED